MCCFLWVVLLGTKPTVGVLVHSRRVDIPHHKAVFDQLCDESHVFDCDAVHGHLRA